MDFSSLFSPGLGVVSSITNALSSRKRQNQAMQFQREENERARAYNKYMADYTNQLARANAREEREYNDPSAVMTRLKRAGLNPDLAMSNSGSYFANATAANVVQPQGVSPADVGSMVMNSPTAGDSLMQGLQAMLTSAQVDKLQTETKKTSGEIQSLDMDNIRKAATLGKAIELDNFQIVLAKSTKDLNDSQLSNLNQQLINLRTQNDLANAQIDTFVAQTKNLDASTMYQRMKTYLDSAQFNNQCIELSQRLKESDARINLTNAQAKEVALLMISKKLNLDANTLAQHAGIKLTNEKAVSELLNQDILKINGKQLEFNYNQSQKFDTVSRVLSTANAGVSLIGNAVQSLASARFLLRH